MDWEIKIKKVRNGYIVTHMADESEEIEETIFQEKDSEDGELEAMQEVLYFVKEYFGIYYSKHNKKNIIIDIQENESI